MGAVPPIIGILGECLGLAVIREAVGKLNFPLASRRVWQFQRETKIRFLSPLNLPARRARQLLGFRPHKKLRNSTPLSEAVRIVRCGNVSKTSMEGIEEKPEPLVGVMLKLLGKAWKVPSEIRDTSPDVAVVAGVCHAVLESLVCLRHSVQSLGGNAHKPIAKTADVQKRLKDSVKITREPKIG
jgi:hypothetical protein